MVGGLEGGGVGQRSVDVTMPPPAKGSYRFLCVLSVSIRNVFLIFSTTLSKIFCLVTK